MQSESTVYLSLGSNLGDRVGNIKRALRRISVFGTVVSTSPYYETEPFGVTVPQPRFINSAAKLTTALKPEALAENLRSTERQLGRISKGGNLPRVIDIDMLCYDKLVVSTESLTLPHPQIFDRLFVLVPLCDLAPDLVIPPNGDVVRDLLAALSKTDQTKLRQVTEDEIYS